MNQLLQPLRLTIPKCNPSRQQRIPGILSLGSNRQSNRLNLNPTLQHMDISEKAPEHPSIQQREMHISFQTHTGAKRVNRREVPIAKWFEKESHGVLFPVAVLAIISTLLLLAQTWLGDESHRKRLRDFEAYTIPKPDHTRNSIAASILEKSNDYVHRNTTHDVTRQIQPSENWIQWIAGQFYSPLLRTQNPKLLAAYGRGDCSERAAVLQWLLRRNGIPSRFVGLGGHVVLEAEEDGKLWTLDPDYGLAFPIGVQTLSESASIPLQMSLLQAGVEPQSARNYEAILTSPEDNVYLPWNAPLSPRLRSFEELCEWLLWCSPAVAWIAILAIGRPR